MENRHQDSVALCAAFYDDWRALSIGVAWLVIVAAEMLTGGVGIGFWVWDEWNNLEC